MDALEREQTIRVLDRIPKEDWDRFLHSTEGTSLRERLDAARAALRVAGAVSGGAVPRPSAEVVDLYGHRLLCNKALAPWLRLQILRQMAPGRWQNLSSLYRQCTSERAGMFHGNMRQDAQGSTVMAEYWKRGSYWASDFCEAAGLPACLGASYSRALPDDEEVSPAHPLPPLHDFQVPVYRSLRRLLNAGHGTAAMLSLPTGAGKTRVAVEALCDHLVETSLAASHRNMVLWIAQSNELQLQAWECIRQVWQVAPERADGRAGVRRVAPLRIVRLWGGRDPDELEWGDEPAVLVASIDQLASWTRNRPGVLESFPGRRFAAVFLDEAHSVLTKEYKAVLTALRLRQQYRWQTISDAPPVIGLTATPWRTVDDQQHSLSSYFHRHLVGPEVLGRRPVRELQRRRILSRVDAARLRIQGGPEMTRGQEARLEKFGDLPADYLANLGASGYRNARVLEALARLPKRSRILVFGCSVEHAEVLSMVLDRYFQRDCSAVVTAHTPRAERASVIERFKSGDGLRFLCNVGVLAAGFDAPKIDVVCLTRPTMSAVRYEQMVGRGLRGPRNGGTDCCRVLDVQDDGLPVDVQSYGRVLELWDGRRR